MTEELPISHMRVAQGMSLIDIFFSLAALIGSAWRDLRTAAGC